MSMDKVTKAAISSGNWAQCIFCSSAYPKREWTKNPNWFGKRDCVAIKESGYCTDCEKFAGPGSQN